MTTPKTNVCYLIPICLVATLGGLLFGYDTGVISGAIEPLAAKFAPATLRNTGCQTTEQSGASLKIELHRSVRDLDQYPASRQSLNQITLLTPAPGVVMQFSP